MTKIYKNQEGLYTIQTDAQSEETFICELGSALMTALDNILSLIKQGKLPDDFNIKQFYGQLVVESVAAAVDISCHLRGYKSKVGLYQMILGGCLDSNIELGDLVAGSIKIEMPDVVLFGPEDIEEEKEKEAQL